jgi:hypothetical protein
MCLMNVRLYVRSHRSKEISLKPCAQQASDRVVVRSVITMLCHEQENLCQVTESETDNS